MIIEKIDIKSFGMLTDMTLEFSESVNVIEGQNEAGKSTIAAFIKYMLFGFDGTEKETTLTERKKRINWTTGTAQGSMTVKVKGKRYLITRSTVPVDSDSARTTYKEECAIIDMESGANVFGKIPAGEVFFDVSRELFENTAFVGQIGDAAIDEESVRESIENILFSGNEKLNNEKAAAKIADKMDALLHRSGHGGAIFDLMHKQEGLEAAMQRSNEDNKQILAKESELYAIRQEKAEAEEKLERLYDSDNCYKNVMLIQTFDKLHALEEECAEKTEAYNAFIEENTHAGYVPTEQYLTDIAVARRGVNDAYNAMRDAENVYTAERNAIGITREIEGAIELADELGGETEVLTRAKGFRMSAIRDVTFGVLCSVCAVAALIFEIVAKGELAEILFRTLAGLVGGVAAVGAGIFVYLLIKNRRRLGDLSAKFGVHGYSDLVGKISVISEARAKRDGMIRSTENARIARDNARANYDAAKAELTRVIVRWGEEPPLSELNDFLDKLEAKVSAFLERKRMLGEEKNMIELTVREIRRTLSDKNEIDIRAQVPPLKRKSLAGVNHDEIITGIAALKTKIADADRRAFAVESELIALKSRAGDLGEYHSRIYSLESRIAELKNRHKAYFMALRAIESASENLREEISPRLGEFSARLMGIMTDCKYSDFDVSDGLKVTFTARDGEKKSVDFLSGGTRDLAYIAVRMALIDMLYTEKPPICFDESFAHQDNLRARSMMKALSHLSDDGYQSFVFTCRGREGALAGELVKNVGVFKLSLTEGDIA